MAGPKTADNTQWGLVSDTGTRLNPLPNEDGGEPLIDQHGRVWVVAAPSPFPFPGFPTRNQAKADALVDHAELQVGPGALEQINGFVQPAEGVTAYVQLWDLDHWPPVEGDLPFEIIPITDMNGTYAYGPASGWQFVDGLHVSFSLTAFDFTTAGDVGFYNSIFWTP